MNHQQTKLENPVRLKELNPPETLKKIGLREHHILCDIGAGSGIFTIPAAKITQNKVYALEINEELLSVLNEKAKTAGLSNIELVKVQSENLNLRDHSVDIVLLVTVLHEIDHPIVFLKEVKRILKDDGKVAVIEFHKYKTPMGPPQEHRLAKQTAINYLKTIGLKVSEDFDLGDNFYCLVFDSGIL